MKNLRYLTALVLCVAHLNATSAESAVVHAAEAVKVSDLRIEMSLERTGYPVGRVDGVLDQDTRRAICLWRDFSGQNISRNLPSLKERTLIAWTSKPIVPGRLVTGLNISRTCQSVTLVSNSKFKKERFVKKMFKASTGQPGFETRKGSFRIYSQVDKWIESDLYPGSMMYRPKFFSGGQALHGSWSDSLVLPYPASHGCVRMLHSSIDYLWSHGVGIGTKVLVYGNWKG